MSGNGSQLDVEEQRQQEADRAQRQAAREAAREETEATQRAAAAAAEAERVAQAGNMERPVSEIDSLRATVSTMTRAQQKHDEDMARLTGLIERMAAQQAVAPPPQASPVQQQQVAEDEAAFLQRAATTVLELPPVQRDAIKMRMPAVFSGEADKVQRFVDAWDTILMSQTGRTSMQQIALVAQYMEGGAFIWYKTEKLNDHENTASIFTSWATFSAAMLRQFSERQPDSTIMEKLLRVRQLTSAAEYNTRFNALLLQLQKPMQATVSMYQYVRGLKDDVQMKLAGQEYLTLSALQRAAADIDATLFQTQRRINARVALSHSSNAGKLNQVSASASATSDIQPSHATPSLAQEVVMILSELSTKRRADQSKWTQEMKERYAKNQCFTCAESGHSARFCPKKQLKE